MDVETDRDNDGEEGINGEKQTDTGRGRRWIESRENRETERQIEGIK